ncbi:hypothetical protein F1654_10265 [Alkalicaulis satelles]|uniref:Tetratricopeptide repeat protein n=1 Tax=Alkalicaulis satelles TaxID=2609175 RepID=A0A5M6ZD24_9PROT|nr:hypothetical protein [Alkalicaulis satelles]KAA5802215.1 hypothetical protein F1654_10265 [Alkalicaulis satelles]
MSISWITAAALAAGAASAPAGPHLAGEDYITVRGAPLEALAETRWTRTRAPLDGDIAAAANGVVFAARLGPDWAQWRSSGGAETLADWRTRRLLTLSEDGERLTNASLYGETRRRLDTYVALSGAGALEEIDFGEAGVFHRIWLEAAMGLAAQPGALEIEESDHGFTASFDGERIFRADFGGGEASLCEAESLTGGAARSARLWLRHAAPVHPDLLDQLAQGERFPCAFELTVYSPDSPQGRLERWVMHAPPAEAAEESEEQDAAEAAESEAAEVEETAPDSDAAEDQEAESEAETEAETPEPSLTELLDRLASGEDVDADLILRALDTPRAAPATAPAPDPRPAPASRPAAFDMDEALILRLPHASGARLAIKGDDYLETAGQAALAAVRGEISPPDAADFYEEFEIARSTARLAEALLISVQETHHFGPCPQDAVVGGERLTCTLVRDLARSGVGNAQFERAAGGIDAALEGAHRSAVESLSPFVDLEGPGGVAARLLTASALIGWGADGLAARPDLDPVGLMLEAIEEDPLAPDAYWRLGQRFMEAGAPETAWTLYDLGRNLPGRSDPPALAGIVTIEARITELAPQWLPDHTAD